VDVLVRDKHGRPVIDLTAADFELYERDVRQEISSVRLVAPGVSAASAGATAPAAPPGGCGASDRPANTIDAPTFVALVFDRLTPEGRALAHKGAMAYLEGAGADDFAGVFLSDLRLETVQTYTNDRAKVRTAIREAASRATSSFSRDGARVGSTAQGDAHPSVSPTAGAESHGPAAGQTASRPQGDPGQQDASAVMLQRMVARMDRAYEMLVRDQQGLATTNALFAVIDGLALLPGRKTVVFFAESLALPPRVLARFESVVASANRANVSVYAIDAAGLRVHSTTAETARQVRALGARSLGDNPVLDSNAWSQDLEVNEDVLRQDPDVSLRILAERTGGFLINNTNDLERGFRQIDADRRFHYLLTYTPTDGDFRGDWRGITVKVSRRDTTVRARSGYLAVHEPGVLPLLSYEGPALAALERSPMPTDLPVRAGALVFPQPTGAARLAVLVATNLGALTFDTQNGSQTYRTDFTVLARIRNSAGDVVRKASQPYRLTGPVSQVAAARIGDVLLFRQLDLEPGTYTLEYVVHDAIGTRSGAGVLPMTVPDARQGQLRMSSLVIVQRTERLPATERTGTNPLYYEDLLLYPNLGEPMSKRATKALSFFFAVIPASGDARPRAALELLQGGRIVGHAPLELPVPAADGRIQHVSQLPLASVPPGEYELRIVVTQGSQRQARSATVGVVD